MYYAELNVPKNHVYLFKPQSGEMHMRRRNEVFGCIPHVRGAYLKLFLGEPLT